MRPTVWRRECPLASACTTAVAPDLLSSFGLSALPLDGELPVDLLERREKREWVSGLQTLFPQLWPLSKLCFLGALRAYSRLSQALICISSNCLKQTWARGRRPGRKLIRRRESASDNECWKICQPRWLRSALLGNGGNWDLKVVRGGSHHCLPQGLKSSPPLTSGVRLSEEHEFFLAWDVMLSQGGSCRWLKLCFGVWRRRPGFRSSMLPSLLQPHLQGKKMVAIVWASHKAQVRHERENLHKSAMNPAVSEGTTITTQTKLCVRVNNICLLCYQLII